MSQPKVGAIGLLLFISIVLTAVSVFTNGWVVASASGAGVKVSQGTGIIPYDSNNPGWFLAASMMMFISLGLFVILALVYLHAAWKVHHHGCCHSIRHSFHSIAFLGIVIACLEITAFILVAVNAGESLTYYSVTANQGVGYSGYLALSSGIITVIAAGLAGHVSHSECH